MKVVFILVFTIMGLVIGWLKPRRSSTGLILALSALSIFWLQPLTPIRNLDFWLPTASIALTIFVWAATYPGEKGMARQAAPGVVILVLVILGIAATRYTGALCCLTPSRPPQLLFVCAAIAIILVIQSIFIFPLRGNPFAPIAVGGIILILFIVLKNEALGQLSSAWLRRWTNQPVELAHSTDLGWLGFSFLAFRFLHVIRDRQANRLPAYSLSEFASYALFFPAVVSGPIDRSQHFINELHKAEEEKSEPGWKENAARNTTSGIQRILIGSFKKLVLADSLAVFALNSRNAVEATSTIWIWVLLMAYSLQIYLDFSGYTDIALGAARLIGIELPENFDRPYSKQNLANFWNSWHITLAQWFRSYVFYPLTRYLRTHEQPLPTWAIILAGQFLTMSLIGLWHGITWNFFIWGAWHGLGLFVQNRWSDWLRPRLAINALSPSAHMALKGSGWLVTFLFVCLGWVWFALPTPELALSTFAKLAGAGL